jgi:membrane associated rhomboid family serine protease
MQKTPALNLPPVVLWFALGLIAVHGVRHLLTEEQDLWVLLLLAFVPARYGELSAQLPGGAAAAFWSPATYALLHADGVHLFVNLVWMASFGSALARRFGTSRFLVLALLAAVSGAAAHYIVHPGEAVPVIGASAAVSGMIAATARFAFAPGVRLGAPGAMERVRMRAEPLLAVLRNPRALAFILVWFAVNLLFGLTEGLVPGASGPIAWEAHIGGFLAGLLAFPLLDPVGRARDPLAK